MKDSPGLIGKESTEEAIGPGEIPSVILGSHLGKQLPIPSTMSEKASEMLHT